MEILHIDRLQRAFPHGQGTRILERGAYDEIERLSSRKRS